jgi:hypothetical protein
MAHGRRCFYTSTPFSFSELHIDHIIPERLKNKPEELRHLLRDYGLPESFNLHGYENLVPTTAQQNIRKADAVPDKNAALHYIGLAQKKRSEVERLVEQAEKEAKQDRIRIALTLAIEQGTLNGKDLTRLVNEALQHAGGISIPGGLAFADGAVLSEFDVEDAKQMLSRPLLPRRHGLDVLTMRTANGAERQVTTCDEWAICLKEGYYAATTYDIKEESFFKYVHAVATAILTGEPAQISYLRNPWISVMSFDVLPVTILPALSTDDVELLTQWDAQGMTIAKLITAGEVTVVEATESSVSIRFRGMGMQLTELLRRDLDGDGMEDILVRCYQWAEGGTFGAGNVIVLSRYDNASSLVRRRDIILLPDNSNSVQPTPAAT